MITAEEVIIRHFRLKVNLSKFFQDARKFCWIFIDGTKIRQVMHIKQHISSVFNITEPFHLLLNDAEYLPPNEDVRILKENETILVVPGSGLDNENVNKTEMHNRYTIFTQDKKDQKRNDLKAEIVNGETPSSHHVNTTLSSALNNTRVSINNTTADMTFYSMRDETVIENPEENDSKFTDNSTIEDTHMVDVSKPLKTTSSSQDNTYYTEDTEEEADFKDTDTKVKNEINLANFLVPVTKRKRVRKRRPRNRSQSHILHSDINDEEKPKKPRIIDSYVIPSRKHIKFNIEDNENDVAKKIVQEVSGNESSGGIYKDLKNFSSRESSLSSLLALRQCSTPKTYVNNKIKVIRVESLSNKEIKTNIPNIIKIENVKNIEKNSCDNSTDKQIHKENLKGSELAVEDYSVMNRKPQVEDIIAFKTLKIGADFTPQLSNFIVAKVMKLCAQSLNYTLKIISGKEEVQVPFGKFSVSEDESVSENDTDAFKLNYSQMQDLRLVV